MASAVRHDHKPDQEFNRTDVADDAAVIITIHPRLSEMIGILAC